MQVLQKRSDDFMAPRRARGGPLPLYPPLLEWFMLASDEQFVELPAPTPKRTPTPRRYRGSAQLRAQRDRLDAQRTAIMFGGHHDPAACNVAGPARWNKLDRDVAKVAALTKRIDRLDARIRSAQHRENRQHTT